LSARDNGSGRSNQIQIKNDKGRLSQEEIQRMLKDAEKFKREDEKQRERVSAKNQLESYIFSVKQALDASRTSNLSSSDKNKIEEACNKELKWLDANQTADREEYEFHYKELSRKCSPIMSKMHSSSSSSNGPRVEEVD
jgi:heat shock 70kDa protein 1/2/6/8